MPARSIILLLPLTLLVPSLVACGTSAKERAPGDEKVRAVAKVCADGVALLSEKLDDKTFREAMATTMGACADACNGKDETSCKSLDLQLDRLCKVSKDACRSLCDPARPGALTDAACKHNAAKASSVGSTAAAPPITTYVAADGRFAIKPPIATDPVIKDVPDPNGGSWHQLSWQTADGLCAVQTRSYGSHAEAVAETAGFIPTRDSGAIARDKQIELGGHDGRDLEWTVGRNTLRTRFVIVDNVVFKAMAGGRSLDGGGREAFVSSFELRAATTVAVEPNAAEPRAPIARKAARTPANKPPQAASSTQEDRMKQGREVVRRYKAAKAEDAANATDDAF